MSRITEAGGAGAGARPLAGGVACGSRRGGRCPSARRIGRQAVRWRTTNILTTPHFNGRAAVLIRICQLDRISFEDMNERVAEARLSQAPRARTRESWSAQTIGGGEL